MKKAIRLGDPTSHGGQVVSATARFKVMGIKVARKGDSCTCPIPGHSGCVIAEGDPTWRIDGVPIALEGHKTSCGAALIATVPNVARG